MKRAQKARYFAMGLISALLVSALIIPAGASLLAKTIQVFTGVDLYVDDVKLMPKDAQGNPVEVFVYNGTTYLPVRAVASALGTVVEWEGKTSSVFVGKHGGEKPNVWLKDLDYFTRPYDWYRVLEPGGKDNMGNSYLNEIACRYFDTTYIINGQYSKMTGTFFQRYDYRSEATNGNMKVYADGSLIFDAEMSSGIEPLFFDIDLTGVLKLRIVVSHSGANANIREIALGNCGFYLA